ncbi:hypothetical protein EMMF5_000113 [Cystobasidiomycetes sp. EMM_F5]
MNEEAGTSTKGNAAQFSEKSSEDAAKTLVDDPEGGALGVRAILGVVLGVGLGSSFTPSVACVTSYYKKKRGLANALLSSGSAVSGLVIPIYLSKMINNPKIGLDWALRTSGFLCFVFQGLAWLVMKQKKLPPNHRPLLDFSVFRSPSYTCTVFAYMATVLGIFYPVFYIQSFARYKGVDKDTAFWSIAIFNGSYVTLTPVVAANLSDHPSRIGTHIGMAFLVNALGAISGQPALGAVVAATGQYWQAALIAGAFLTIASVLITTSNLLFRKRMGTWRV